jgi:glyoxylase-like metal-dependent hydrolase (beta-lactamase superfamily II)
MKPILEYTMVRPGLFIWQGYEPRVKCDCSSTALVTLAGLVFIDPIPLAEEALKELVREAGSAPVAVVLTSGNHQRESLHLAKQLKIPIFAPRDGENELSAVQYFSPEEAVAGMQSIPLPGFGPGETAFYFKGILIFGDALIHLEPDGLRLLPEKYRLDKKLALSALDVLKKLTPEILLFAHGYPIVTQAGERLRAALVSES